LRAVRHIPFRVFLLGQISLAVGAIAHTGGVLAAWVFHLRANA